MESDAKFIDDRLESYVEAMYEASKILVDQSPDFILAPMNGSVPFIDAMTIVNQDFDTSKVVYMPASSSVENVLDVITDWYSNFLDENVKQHYEIPKVIGIDEVVSGNSVVRCMRSIDRATNRKRKKEIQLLVDRIRSDDFDVSVEAVNDIDQMYDNEHVAELSRIRGNLRNGFYKNPGVQAKSDLKFCIDLAKRHLSDGLTYRTIGIEDSKKTEEGRHKEYRQVKDEGRVIPVGVNSIISMDLPDFCPPRFQRLPESSTRNNHVAFSPFVEDFRVTPRYIEFLEGLATVVGQNPQTVNPVNMGQILDSKRYLGEKYTSQYPGN